MTEKFINLTPHAVSVLSNGEWVKIPSTGLARVASVVEDVRIFAGVRIVKTRYGEVTGLPEPEEGVLYIVSGMVLSALAGSRSDVVGPTLYNRDENGQVIGAAALTL